MKIETLADLEKTIKLCRKLGVTNIEVDGIKLSLNEYEAPKRRAKATSDTIETEDEITEEQVLFWSSESRV